MNNLMANLFIANPEGTGAQVYYARKVLAAVLGGSHSDIKLRLEHTKAKKNPLLPEEYDISQATIQATFPKGKMNTGKVKIGNNVKIYSHVNISGNTKIGNNNKIYPFASIGNDPQDLKYNGEETKLIIGNNNIFYEYYDSYLVNKLI